MAQIELKELTRDVVRSLNGQERGVAAREFFQVDELDRVNEPVIVRVPNNLDSISPSFLRGMFALSIAALGTSGFMNHYVFDAPIEILEQVDRAVKGTLADQGDVLA
jgi:hypothetical protein